VRCGGSVPRQVAEARYLSPEEARRVYDRLGLDVSPVMVSLASERLRRWPPRAEVRRSPKLVGGCRPTRIATYLPSSDWVILARRIVTSFGVPPEVVVAQRTD
jgi:hypothetical protein